MSYFSYRVVRADGTLMRDVVELPFLTESSAREYFESRGVTVLAIRRISDWLGRWRVLGERHLGRQVTREDLIEFLRNMSVMLRSGIPILTALEDTVSLADNRALVKTVASIQGSIEAGMQFADALDQHPHAFPETVRFLARIGEESGNLDRTLDDAAGHLMRLRQINADARKSLIYPAIVLVTTVLAAMFWVLYVIPGVTDLFTQMQLPLPEFTVMLLSGAGYLRQYALQVAVAGAAIVLAAALAIRQSRAVRRRYHQLLLVLPISGTITRASGLAFVAEYLSLFVSSGIDILKSLRTLESTVSNEVYRDKLTRIRQGLEIGNPLSEEFRRAGVFPSFVVRMIAIGEQSGTLAEQLRYVAEEYRRRLRDVVDNISELVKPAAMILVGGLFVIIVIGLFLPVYKLIGNAGFSGF